MVFNLLTKVFGSKNERELKQIQPLVDKINTLEPSVQALSDEQLKGRTAEFKQRLDRGENIDDLLPEAFATVREASIRTLDMRHFDAGRHATRLPKRIIRKRCAHYYRQRLFSPT